MKPTLVEPQSPSGYGKVPFATSGPPNLTNTGDNHKNNYKNIILEICQGKTIPHFLTHFASYVTYLLEIEFDGYCLVAIALFG